MTVDVSELQDAFAVFDDDGDGVITTVELGKIMESLGKKLSYRKWVFLFKSKSNCRFFDFSSVFYPNSRFDKHE